MNCQICNQDGEKDLFSSVTGDPVCCICKVKYIGGLPTSPERVAAARKKLGLQPGEFLKHDYGEEAAKILGRSPLGGTRSERSTDKKTCSQCGKPVEMVVTLQPLREGDKPTPPVCGKCFDKACKDVVASIGKPDDD